MQLHTFDVAADVFAADIHRWGLNPPMPRLLFDGLQVVTDLSSSGGGGEDAGLTLRCATIGIFLTSIPALIITFSALLQCGFGGWSTNMTTCDRPSNTLSNNVALPVAPPLPGMWAHFGPQRTGADAIASFSKNIGLPGGWTTGAYCWAAGLAAQSSAVSTASHRPAETTIF